MRASPRSRLLRLACVVALFFALQPAAPAKAVGASPAINAPYQHPDYDVWVRRFERPGREVYDRRAQIVAATGVKSGMAVADIGAGTGLFTRLFSARPARFMRSIYPGRSSNTSWRAATPWGKPMWWAWSTINPP